MAGRLRHQPGLRSVRRPDRWRPTRRARWPPNRGHGAGCPEDGGAPRLSHPIPDRIIQVAPTGPFADHGLQIFLQYDSILHWVFDHGTYDVRRKRRGVDLTIAEMRGLGPGGDADRDCLAGG